MNSLLNSNYFNKLKNNYKHRYDKNLSLTFNIYPINLNKNYIIHFFNSKKKELEFDIFDYEINIVKKCKLILYGYIKDDKFIWIKGYNKFFYDKLKKKINPIILNYFFNKICINLKNNKLNFVIPYLIFSLVTTHNFIEIPDMNNNIFYGMYYM